MVHERTRIAMLRLKLHCNREDSHFKLLENLSLERSTGLQLTSDCLEAPKERGREGTFRKKSIIEQYEVQSSSPFLERTPSALPLHETSSHVEA
jgi:hypothetical protein